MQDDQKTRTQQLLVRAIVVCIAVPFLAIGIFISALVVEQEERREWVTQKMSSMSPLHGFLVNEFMICRQHSQQARSLCVAPLAEAARVKGYKRKDIQQAFSDLENLEQQAEREVDYFGMSS